VAFQIQSEEPSRRSPTSELFSENITKNTDYYNHVTNIFLRRRRSGTLQELLRLSECSDALSSTRRLRQIIPTSGGASIEGARAPPLLKFCQQPLKLNVTKYNISPFIITEKSASPFTGAGRTCVYGSEQTFHGRCGKDSFSLADER